MKEDAELGEVLAQVTTEDLIEYGLIPEFVGRLPVISALAPLDKQGLIRVLTEPKNSLLKQYQALFEMENCGLEFSAGALDLVATRAMVRGVGARGLRGILEEIMLDVMFELPDQPAGSKFLIDEDVIAGRRVLFTAAEPQSKSA
jgi:ATP-dependent Clp protease ATP-binding subunit ClpX